MARERLQPTMTWAEDRATQRCDPSADSGAETGVGIGLRRPVPLPSRALRDWHESDKPSRQDAVILPTRCRHQLANLKPSRFQFAVNQDTTIAAPTNSRCAIRNRKRCFIYPCCCFFPSGASGPVKGSGAPTLRTFSADKASTGVITKHRQKMVNATPVNLLKFGYIRNSQLVNNH